MSGTIHVSIEPPDTYRTRTDEVVRLWMSNGEAGSRASMAVLVRSVSDNTTDAAAWSSFVADVLARVVREAVEAFVASHDTATAVVAGTTETAREVQQ